GWGQKNGGACSNPQAAATKLGGVGRTRQYPNTSLAHCGELDDGPARPAEQELQPAKPAWREGERLQRAMKRAAQRVGCLAPASKKRCSTRSPGFNPSRSAAPPASSKHAVTSPLEAMMSSDSGSVRASMRCTVPSARMNTMSSGM